MARKPQVAIAYNPTGMEPDAEFDSRRIKQLDCYHVSEIASNSEDMIGFVRPRYYGRDEDYDEE